MLKRSVVLVAENIHTIYGIQMFINQLKRDFHWTLARVS